MALWRQGGKIKESLQLRLWNLNSTSNSPVVPRRMSCQISANQQKVETKKGPRVMTSLLMSYPPISISHRLFPCRYSNSRDVVATSPSFSRPAAREHRRAGSQAIIIRQGKARQYLIQVLIQRRKKHTRTQRRAVSNNFVVQV